MSGPLSTIGTFRTGQFAFRSWLLAMIAGVSVSGAEKANSIPPADDANLAGAYRWFSLPLEVAGIPSAADFVPVSCSIDFTGILNRLDAPGAVDERSLRLFEIASDGRETEEPIQFIASPQPRPKAKRSLPDTPANVSYLGEYPAGETPDIPRVAGELFWIVRGADSTDSRDLADPLTRKYRLRFGVPRAGRFTQVPFPPQNLRAFDAQGRALPVHWFPRVQIRPQWPAQGLVHILDDNQLAASYHIGPLDQPPGAAPTVFRRPFLYPVIGPDGVALTELGKPHDPTGSHAHHNSLWIAHASVNGKDFWSEKGGWIAHEQFELMEDGPLFCRLVQRNRWRDHKTSLLLEKRQITVYHAGEDFRRIDLDLEFTPAGAKPVVFGKTSFGFLAIRVAQSMTVFDGGGEIRNAIGDRNEQGAHLKHADWLDQSGPVAPGQWNGIAIFDHPENVHHPTGWHCRNDGWAGAAFNLESQYTLESGAKLRLRYGVLLHRGDSVEGRVAQRYRAYAAKPLIETGPATADP